MPNLREHHKHDRETFGPQIANKYKFVHRLMDSAQPVLQERHRKLFHDSNTLMMIYWYHGSMALIIALEHLRLDKERTNLNRRKSKNKQ